LRPSRTRRPPRSSTATLRSAAKHEAPFDGHARAASPGGAIEAQTPSPLSYAPGKVGQAWRAQPGATCRLPADGLFASDAGAFDCWAQPSWDSADGKQHYLLADDNHLFKVYKHTDGALYCQIRLLDGPSAWISAGGKVNWKANEWHHVVVSWSGLSKRDTPATAAIYADDRPVAWQQAKGALSPLGRRVWIGSDARGTKSFDGLIDEVKMFSTPQSSLERPVSIATSGPAEMPTDDPYLSEVFFADRPASRPALGPAVRPADRQKTFARALTPDASPDPLHLLDTVRSSEWDHLSATTLRDVFGDSPAERVIYRDSVTGAEVWLLTRSAAGAGIAYTNYRPYNADGSLLRIWGRDGLCMKPDGTIVSTFKQLIPHDYSGLPEWSRTDPNVVICQTASGGTFEFNLKTKTRRDLYIPDDSIPKGTQIQFSDDRQVSLFVTRQGGRRPLWVWIGDAKGQDRREVPIRSRSPKPDEDRMGSAALLRDQQGQLYARYSLNKGFSQNCSTPYQNWLVTLDGKTFREMDSQNSLLDGTPLHFIPAGSYVVTGHGGYSPSGKSFVHHSGRSGYKYVRDLATWTQRDIARIPGCDHMDWTVDDNWFFVWAQQPGLPIYQTFVDTGVTHRIVCSNSCPHFYDGCPYHGSSPDGTKLVYKSAMLGTLQVYQAVVRYPDPPVQVVLRREGNAVALSWKPPERHKEIRGYNVYRSTVSGGGYSRLNRDLVTGLAFTDAEPPTPAHYVLTSVEHSGLESRVFSTGTATDGAKAISIYVEAENGRLTYPMREVFLPASASANFAVTRAVRDSLWYPASGTARAEWDVAVPREDTYFVWARVRARGQTPSPVEVSLAGRPVGQIAGAGQAFEWMRVPGNGVKLTSGQNRLSAQMSAPGIELDKCLLTTDQTLTPTGMGNWPTAAPAQVTGLSAKFDQGCVVIRWKPSEDLAFHHYRVYRGDAPDFQPTQRNLLGSPSVAAFADPGPWSQGRVCYKVAAVDTWSNESPLSETAMVAVSEPGPKTTLFVEAESGTASGGAAVISDAKAEGGKAVAFGDPEGVPENAGELAIPIDAPPGSYSVWLRVKGSPLKDTAFFYVRLGESEHYSRMPVSSWVKEQEWQWRRVTFLNTVKDPQERPMTYKVTQRGTTLRIRHRANYFAIDRILLASDPTALPAPDAWQAHAGCEYAFRR